MKTKIFIAISILALYSVRIAAQSTTFDYLGQTPPGDTAKIFAPGLVSVNNQLEFSVLFSPDNNEAYIHRVVNDKEVIMLSKRVNGIWSEQKAFKNGAMSLFISADGKKLFYSYDFKIIMRERTGDGWGSEQILSSPISTNTWEEYVETADGNVYISSMRPGGRGQMDIWRINSSPGQISKAENLGSVINTSNNEFAPCIAKDGSYIIFTSDRIGGTGLQNLYISFNKGNNLWTQAIELEKNGSGINIKNFHQSSPTLSPDGKYLFFTRHNSTLTISDIYWVSTNVIEVLKKQMFAPKLSKQIPNISAKAGNLINYVIPSNTFTCEYGAESLTYTASLKNGAALPSWLTFNAATRNLSGIPNKAGDEIITITASNKDGVSASCSFQISALFDYLGQTPPGDTAKIFAPGIISLTNRNEYGINFSPDGNECYFTIINNVSKVYFRKRVNNVWSSDTIAPFCINQQAEGSGLSEDGKTLYFSRDGDIWKVDRINNKWSEPQLLPAPYNSTSDDASITFTNDSVAYIYSNRAGSTTGSPMGLNYDIWRIRRSTNQTLIAENMGSPINTSLWEVTPCIAPDGSYIIFTKSNTAYMHLYVSFNKGNNQWTTPVNMDSKYAGINSLIFNQNSPTLSPDGKYLFFNKHTQTTADIYWVSTNIIDVLKKQIFAPKLSIQIPNINAKTGNLINYVIPANTFTCEYGADALQYTATLKNGAALPSWLSFNTTTKTLSGTPKQSVTDSIKITTTNKDNLSASCTFKIEVTSATGMVKPEAQTIEIYPNPSSGVFNINISDVSAKNAKVEIYDFSGKLVLSEKPEKGVVDLTGYQIGIYVAKITLNNLVVTKKISIQ